jgi:thiol:disulfide interchange protein
VVIALAVVMVLIGLNLLGAFEIGASVGRASAMDLAGRGGRFGAFMTGALAVVVATPCTAPFMGAAMGYAVAQPPVAGFGCVRGAGARLRACRWSRSRSRRASCACCRSPAAGCWC